MDCNYAAYIYFPGYLAASLCHTVIWPQIILQGIPELMATVSLIAALWMAGGALCLSGMVPEAPNEDLADCLAGVRDFEPAALLALAMFLAVWPVVFVGAHLGKRRSNG